MISSLIACYDSRERMARTIVVGDLHGCMEELLTLLDEVSFDGGRDRLVSVGDIVGKGPRGAELVRLFRKRGYSAVRGNHDEKLIAWRRGESSKSLGPAHRPDASRMGDADWRWLESLPLYLELPEHDAIIVHGGLVPGVPLDEQDPHVLLNLRSFRSDGSPSKRVDAGEPWAKRWPGPALVVFGHDAVRGLQRWPHAIGLDTGCVYGGQLSALLLPERRIVSVAARAAYASRENIGS